MENLGKIQGILSLLECGHPAEMSHRVHWNPFSLSDCLKCYVSD